MMMRDVVYCRIVSGGCIYVRMLVYDGVWLNVVLCGDM